MDTKVMVVGSAKTRTNQRRRPRIRLSGFWLDDIGFVYNRLVTVSSEYGGITLKLHGSGIDTYKSLVQSVRRTKSGLIQVRQEYKNKKMTTYMDFKGFWLEELGFHIGSVIVLQFEYGLIHIKVLDLEKLKQEGLI